MSDFHSFNASWAADYGLEEAIMIQSFKWWISKNRAEGRNQRGGRTWSYTTYEGLANSFEYWTPKQVRRIVDSLVEQGILIKERHPGEETWYAFADENAFLPALPDPDRVLPKRAKGSAQTGRSYKESVSDTVPTPLPPEGTPSAVGVVDEFTEATSPEIEERKRFAAYRKSMFDYFGRPETPREWAEVKETVQGWLERGLPPLPPANFRRYCLEEKEKLRAKDDVPRSTKPLITRIALEATRIAGRDE